MTIKLLNRAFPLFLLFLAQQNLSAQVEMRWDTHGVGFTVPNNFKIETNNAEEYTASNDELFLSIIPIQDENLTKEHLAEAVVEMAKELEYDVVDVADEATMQDLTGYYVIGQKDGVNALLMAMMDTESSTNLLVVIVYADNQQRAALKIANSFFAYD
jgi:hypothetical protein